MKKIILGILTLSLLLASCQTKQPSQSPPESSTGKVPKIGSASVDSDIQQTVEDGEITINFTVPMNRASVERALTLFPERYAPEANSADLTPLALTFLCSRTWKVTNPNATPVSFTWDTTRASERGVGVVPADSSVHFYSVTNGKKVQLYVDGAVQDTNQSDQEPCDRTKGTFDWNADNTVLTFTPAPALNEGQAYTLVLSTGAKSQNGVALTEPYIATVNGVIAQESAIEIALARLESLGIVYEAASMKLTTEETDNTWVTTLQRKEFTRGGGHRVTIEKYNGEILSVRHLQ